MRTFFAILATAVLAWPADAALINFNRVNINNGGAGRGSINVNLNRGVHHDRVNLNIINGYNANGFRLRLGYGGYNFGFGGYSNFNSYAAGFAGFPTYYGYSCPPPAALPPADAPPCNAGYAYYGAPLYSYGYSLPTYGYYGGGGCNVAFNGYANGFGFRRFGGFHH